MSVQRGVDAGASWLMMLLVVGAIWSYNQIMYWIAARPFEPIVQEVAHLCAASAPSGTLGGGYRTGKVLMIDAKAGRVHEQFRKLNQSIRAQNSDDVDMIVCLEEIENRVGTYTNGAGAYQIGYRVWIIDLDSRQMVGGRTSGAVRHLRSYGVVNLAQVADHSQSLIAGWPIYLCRRRESGVVC